MILYNMQITPVRSRAYEQRGIIGIFTMSQGYEEFRFVEEWGKFLGVDKFVSVD